MNEATIKKRWDWMACKSEVVINNSKKGEWRPWVGSVVAAVEEIQTRRMK